jgi:hypothetical protein
MVILEARGGGVAMVINCAQVLAATQLDLVVDSLG